jgi:hypothetical protein
MIPELLDPAVLDELAEIVEEMLDGLVETAEVSPSALLGDVDPAVVTGTVEASVPVLGADPMVFTVRMPATEAVALSASLTGDTVATTTVDDARATVGEITNLLAGSAKTLVEDETSLGTPTTALLGDDADGLSDSVIVDHELGTFQVRLAG